MAQVKLESNYDIEEQTLTHPNALSGSQKLAQDLLAQAEITINGRQPWDIQIHNPKMIDRVFAQGNLGLGESYMDGEWDCAALDEFFFRLLRARLDEKVTGSFGLFWHVLRAKLFNLQSQKRAWQVGQTHYDIGNDLFSAMLDSRMTYTCGYWEHADNLEQAQADKLDLICRKLGLKSGMRLLDIGCGWGSLIGFAAQHYGVKCVGLTISKEQAALGKEKLKGLPVEFRLCDYRSFNPDGADQFDRVASVGMFEHVGAKNYHAFFQMALRSLKSDGLFLLHTIGKNDVHTAPDPWIDRYIFPNGVLPTLGQIADESQRLFVIEDVHNFSTYYDKTLMAWHKRFEEAWPQLSKHYNDRFYRMWRYYLLSCAGAFRSRCTQLFQVVLSPKGILGGYQCPR